MDYEYIKSMDYFVNPHLTGYGTLPPYLNQHISNTTVKIFNGSRPIWIPSTKVMRDYLLRQHWGGTYQSRSSTWVIGHDGTALSADSIQIDHITEWETIRDTLLHEYRGSNATGTPYSQLTTLPHEDGILIKGIDYVDDPQVLQVFGPDVLYRITNICAIKYFHTIENLRPLSGSINGRRNGLKVSDEDLGIIPPEFISQPLSKKLSSLAAATDEFIRQAFQLVGSLPDANERDLYIDYYSNIADELKQQILDANRSEFL